MPELISQNYLGEIYNMVAEGIKFNEQTFQKAITNFETNAKNSFTPKNMFEKMKKRERL